MHEGLDRETYGRFPDGAEHVPRALVVVKSFAADLERENALIVDRHRSVHRSSEPQRIVLGSEEPLPVMDIDADVRLIAGDALDTEFQVLASLGFQRAVEEPS